MINIKIIIEYDGEKFHGWQRQPSLRTVQGTIEDVLSGLAGKCVQIEGSGRTDAGVHAFAQVASFNWYDKGCVPVQKLQWVLNRHLPQDIFIKDLCVVDEEFHARFSAVGKTYEYCLCASDDRSPLLCTRMYMVPSSIDIERMKLGAQALIGTHDFKSFMASGSHVEDTVRTIYNIEFFVKNLLFDDDGDVNKLSEKQVANNTGKRLIKIQFTGNGFLYNMVRILTGLLVDIGLGKKSVEDVPAIINAMDRTMVEHTAPAHGLYLKEVYY